MAGYAIVNASVRTLDEVRPEAAAVAIRDGLIVAVGSAAEAREAAGSAEAVDARGGTVTPGLVDAHIHPFAPDLVMGADLTRCATLAEVQSRARGRAQPWRPRRLGARLGRELRGLPRPRDRVGPDRGRGPCERPR